MTVLGLMHHTHFAVGLPRTMWEILHAMSTNVVDALTPF